MSKQRTHIGTWIIALSLCCILTGRLRAQDIVVNPDAETTAEEAQGVSASTATTDEPATVAIPDLKPATPPLSKDMLLLVNGDQLSGMLQTFQQPGKTFWNRSDIDVPFEFDSETLDEIVLGDRPKGTALPRERMRLQLANGDNYTGDWVGLDAEFLTIDTPFSGRLKVPRQHWQWAEFMHSDTQFIFEGPKGLEGWTMGKVTTKELDGGDWAYRNGAFYALKAASIARIIGMPDRMRMEFDMEWKGSLNLAVALYTDYLQPVSLADKDLEPDFGGFYSLQLTSYAVNVLMVKQKEPLQYLGMTQTPIFRQSEKAHIDVRTNKADNSISLLVNGKMVKRWVDQGGFAGMGKGIRLVHQGQGALRVSNIKIREWDGRFEAPPANRPQATQDLLTLRNGDKLVGNLVEASVDSLQFKMGETITAIGLEEVEKIEIGGIQDTVRPVRKGEVNATLVGGGNLQFLLRGIGGDLIHGSSDIYGPIDMKLSAFEKLDFQRVASKENQ